MNNNCTISISLNSSIDLVENKANNYEGYHSIENIFLNPDDAYEKIFCNFTLDELLNNHGKVFVLCAYINQRDSFSYTKNAALEFIHVFLSLQEAQKLQKAFECHSKYLDKSFICENNYPLPPELIECIKNNIVLDSPNKNNVIEIKNSFTFSSKNGNITFYPFWNTIFDQIQDYDIIEHKFSLTEIVEQEIIVLSNQALKIGE